MDRPGGTSQSSRSSLPILARIHILPLSDEAVALLFQSREGAEVSSESSVAGWKYRSTVFSIPESVGGLPIVNYLSHLLQTASSCTLHLFQHFYVCRKHYVIADMEGENHVKTARGHLNAETFIYTEGEPIRPLRYVKLSLVRPFSRSATFQPLPGSSMFPSTKSPSFRRALLRHFFRRHPEDEKNTAVVHDGEGHVCRRAHHDVLESPQIAVNLLTALQIVLKGRDCTVFIRGREVVFPCPSEIPLVMSDPWDDVSRPDGQEPASDEHQQQDQQHLVAAASSPEPSRASSSSFSPSSSPAHLRFFVSSTGEQTLGVLAPGFTRVDLELDPVGEFSRIRVAPAIDTLPQAYEFNFFDAYLRPFIESSPFRLVCRHDLYTYCGLQFKIQKTLPFCKSDVDIPDCGRIYWVPYTGVYPSFTPSEDTSCVRPLAHHSDAIQAWKHQRETYLQGLLSRRCGALCARIGQHTRIHEGRPIGLHWFDLLAPEVVEHICRLPTRLQPFALINALADLSPNDLIRTLSFHEEEVDTETACDDVREKVAASIVEEFSTVYTRAETAPTCCTVCLETLEDGMKILQLPCTHSFHSKCVLTWLKRSTLCPVCRRDLRELLKQQT